MGYILHQNEGNPIRFDEATKMQILCNQSFCPYLGKNSQLCDCSSSIYFSSISYNLYKMTLLFIREQGDVIASGTIFTRSLKNYLCACRRTQRHGHVTAKCAAVTQLKIHVAFYWSRHVRLGNPRKLVSQQIWWKMEILTLILARKQMWRGGWRALDQTRCDKMQPRDLHNISPYGWCTYFSFTFLYFYDPSLTHSLYGFINLILYYLVRVYLYTNFY